MLKYEIELKTDAAIRSCFAEYSKILFDKYDLFYIDTAYREGESGIDNLVSHLEEYNEINLKNEGERDLMGLKLEDAEIIQYMLASDMEGQLMADQAARYMDRYGEAKYRDIFIPNNQVITDESCDDLIERWDMVLSEIPDDNSISELSRRIRSELLNTEQLMDGSCMSLKTLPYDDVPSKRELNRGSYPPEKSRPDINDDLFCDYLMQKLSCFTEYNSDHPLRCELEYLIYGSLNDKDNLEYILNKLISYRESVNLKLLSSDSHAVNEVYSMIDRETSVYDEDTRMKLADCLIYAWAYAESVLEVNRLLCGGRCELSKDPSDLILSVSGLSDYRSHMGSSNGSGLNYKEYLGILLYNADPADKRRRFMDIVEMDIKSMENPYFRIDGCVGYIKAKMSYESSFGYKKYIIRDHEYEGTR